MAERWMLTHERVELIGPGDLGKYEQEGRPIRVVDAVGDEVVFHAANGTSGVGYRIFDNGTLEVLQHGAERPLRVYAPTGWRHVEGDQYRGPQGVSGGQRPQGRR